MNRDGVITNSAKLKSGSPGFTIIELIVAVGLFLMAISVALSAIIGSNNLIVRAEARSSVLESVRAVSDYLRREVVDLSTNAITIEPGNELMTLKKFRPDRAKNVCIRVGRAHYTQNSTTGAETFDFLFSGTKETIGFVVSQFDETSLSCPAVTEASAIIYQGRLTDLKVEATKFQLSLVRPTECQNPQTCGLLRYAISLREAGIQQSAANERRRAVLEIVSALTVGVKE